MIRIENLSIEFPAFQLHNVSFTIPTGKYAVLMGKTGCGKTTILEAICGLKRLKSGKIYFDDQDVSEWSPAERGIGFVPQDGALFATMTVREHLELGPQLRKWPKEDIRKRTEELAEQLGIKHILHRKPDGLSGGECQRIALGRALSFKPKLLCMDEPLSALDEETHEEVAKVIKSLAVEAQVTTLHICHNLNEANQMGDIVYQMKNGKLAIRDMSPEMTNSEKEKYD